jgi:hypothetical protein
MPQDDKDIEAQIEQALGKKQAALMKQNTPRRICGLLTARGRWVEWEKAFQHIAAHFEAGPAKPSHTRFLKKYCDEEAVKDLIKRAAGKPSTVSFAKLNISGMPTGRPGIKIVRAFAEPVGDRPDLVCLVIVADSQGTLVTAYPGTKEEL